MKIPDEIKAHLDIISQDHPEIQELPYMQQINANAPTDMSARECNDKGEALLVEGRRQEAEPWLFAALDKAEQANDLGIQCSATSMLAHLCHHQGNYEQAMVLYQQALGLAERSGNLFEQAKIYGAIGLLHRKQGRLPQAIEHIRKCKEIHEQLGNDEGNQARILNDLACVYGLQGDSGHAIDALQQSLAISLKLGLDSLTAGLYNNLAEIYRKQSRYALALEMAQKGIDIQKRLGDEKTQAQLYGTLAIIYAQQGAFDEALQIMEKNLAIFKRIGDEPHMAVTYGNLAALYLEKGDTTSALEGYHNALDIKERIGDHYGAAIDYANLGKLYSGKIGCAALARQHLEKAKALFELMGNTKEAQQAARILRSL